MIEPIAGERADLEILDHNIRVANQFAYFRLAIGIREVDRYATLAAIAGMKIGRSPRGALGVRNEGRPPATRVVAATGTFDLYDFRAEIREQLSCPGTGEDTGEFDDANSFQRAAHGQKAGMPVIARPRIKP